MTIAPMLFLECTLLPVSPGGAELSAKYINRYIWISLHGCVSLHCGKGTRPYSLTSHSGKFAVRHAQTQLGRLEPYTA